MEEEDGEAVVMALGEEEEDASALLLALAAAPRNAVDTGLRAALRVACASMVLICPSRA